MPYAIPYITLALAAVGTGVSVWQGQEQQAAANKNADIQKGQAQAALQEAQYAADQTRRRNLAVLGRQRATAGASGIQINGSALDVINDSAVQGEMDAQAQLYSGSARSRLDVAQAQNLRTQGNNAALGSYFSAAGTLIGGATSAYGQYTKQNPPQIAGGVSISGSSGAD